MFRLIATLTHGVATDLEEAGVLYDSLDDARRAAQALSRHEVVSRVMIARESVPPEFVEWATTERDDAGARPTEPGA